ncbi:MAG: DUF3298 domain-containing protein [Bacteroidaceae bacterium]|nr:DUF3298 domain-containing protein [Bacteroidaceae bacterium]
MRKSCFRLWALFAVPMLSSIFVSCDFFNKGKGGEADSAQAFTFCTVEFEDSISYMDAHAYQTIRVDFPSEEDSSLLVQQIFNWLCDEVRNRCIPSYESLDIDSFVQASPEGTEHFAEDYVRFYGRQGLDHMQKDLRAMAEEGYSGSFLNHLSIELLENTDSYVTMSSGHEVYLGGAHGGYNSEGISFRKSDGRPFGWDCFDMSKRAELVELLKKGLMGYFNEGVEEKIYTDSALFDNLILYDDPDTPENELEYGLPLPQARPWLTRDGISFIYQQYEIAAYAWGLPNLCLPVEALKNCLTPEGRHFVGID